MNMICVVLAFIFLVILGLFGVQNTETLTVNFLLWKLELSLTLLVLYCAVLGAAFVGILSLPKLANKHFSLKRARRELNKLRDSR
jgi:uncharacterized integral membrane protein